MSENKRTAIVRLSVAQISALRCVCECEPYARAACLAKVIEKEQGSE